MNIEESIVDVCRWARENRDAKSIRAKLAEGGAYIYGAGGYGRLVAQSLRSNNFTLHSFIDTFVGAGQLVDQTACFKPEEIKVGETSGRVLIIAVNNFKVPVKPIADWARCLTFAEILFVPELPDLLDARLGTYWQASRDIVQENSAHISRVFSMLNDEQSRRTYASLVRYRITGLPEDHPNVDRDHQYFPLDLPMPGHEISVVDCGAFPGDMVQAVNSAGHRLIRWFAFEPDPGNFVSLANIARQAEIKSASLFPCGVAERTGTIQFNAGAADASHVTATDGEVGSITVPVVRVDDCVVADRIDLVKLDIEGFEAQAIDGMTALLRAHKPRLATAIYHKPQDLWELPLKVADLFPSARFAIRQHGYNGYDTVLYADL